MQPDIETAPYVNVSIPTLVLELPDGRQIAAFSPGPDGTLRVKRCVPAEVEPLMKRVHEAAVPVPDEAYAHALIGSLGKLRDSAYLA